MPKHHKFPDPQDYRRGDALIFCPNDRVIKVFNEHHEASRKAMAKTVKDWFVAMAKEAGWSECWFLPVAQLATKSAGCVLCHPDHVQVKNHTIVIALPTRSDS